MTVIVAVEADRRTIMGADRLTSVGDGTAWFATDGKIFSLPIEGTDVPAHIGHAGDVVAKCIVETQTLPPFGPNGPDRAWAIRVGTQFADAVANSSATKLEEIAEDSEGISCELILCVKDRVYVITPCEANQLNSSVVAIGSGSEVAVGYLGAVEARTSEYLDYLDVIGCIKYVSAVRTDCGLDRRSPQIVVIDHETGHRMSA